MDQFMNENNSDNMDVLNDVLAVLDADVDFNGHNDHHHHQQQQQQQQEQQQKLQQIQHYLQQQQPQQQQMLPYTFIVEQPASKAIRFRYKCEGRSAGSIPGVNSTPENKTYPTIRVIGYVGRAVVVVSLVTKDSYSGKYRAHPHNLVGKGCIEERGVCHVKISPNNNMEVSFSNLGIQCVKKKEIGTSFKTRKEIRVDPFKAGFSHKNQPIELNVVRLCFEVYLPNEKDEFKIRLEPIVSDPIYDKKAMSDLVICRLSHCCASAAGGTSVILLCEKVLKDDIQVRFFQKINDEVIWEKNAEFTTNDVHKQVAITFKTPKYDLNPDDKAVKVFVQLRRPSDGAVGEPRPFEMIPIGADDPDYLKRKRTRYSNDQTTNCLHELQNSNENRGTKMMCPSNVIKPEPVELLMGQNQPGQWNQPGGSQWNQPGGSQWNQPRCSQWNQPGCSTSIGVPSPLEATSISPNQSPNPNRVILSPRRTPSPMEPMHYNMSPQYHQQVEHSSVQQQFLHPNTGLNQQLPDLLTINSPTQQYNIPHVEPQENTNQLSDSLRNIDVDDLLIDNLSATTLATLSISTDINQAVDAAHQDENINESIDRIVQQLQQ
ncbi:proto-oncogene c-Rel-like isoform X2 [Aphidius gifuensis]|uniref:proto-oncogene c-Rel-like isoform X2 n=1 Tax=Aphidius gifuensis TaxID=684658 RepID=UPI001CDC9196|nr:proto-oncogene c-Rel-like isoform X2 [Aphidius gifuensis]